MNRVIIAVNSGLGLCVIDNAGKYCENINDACVFKDEEDASLYIEKHGLEKMTSIRIIK